MEKKNLGRAEWASIMTEASTKLEGL